MPLPTHRRAAVTVAALLILCALLVRDASRPPAPVAATAPATEFSAERAMVHVREIAQRPHPAGSPENARVREYLLGQLRALGLEPQVQEATGVGTRYPEAGRVRNVLARIPGRTPGGQAVVLMAHYDGVAGGPAAGDDAAGSAAILETLRALRAGPPLAHDVIALITDGEEAGLLGAAAFAREHPWAKDVGVTLNFEARGTEGRSYMFETGPGNLDVVRVLRGARDVSATSLSVTVYRTLPNDTDLSEMAVLGRPALNFAFADGVERYHTAHDDVANLDPGSVQHHGAQMLALARAFGNGPLPRPTTGDAVFFDLPIVGVVLYPEGWAIPLTLAALALVAVAGVMVARQTDHALRDVVLGVVGTLAAVALGAGVAIVTGNAIAREHDLMGWGGAPAFRGIYSAAVAMLALAMALGCWALVRRWANVGGAHIGALIVWGVLALVATWKVPGVSFLFAWPLLAAAIPAMSAGASVTASDEPSVGTSVALWAATLIAAAVLVPVTYTISAVLLGVVGPGGIAVGVLVPLLAWVLAPQLEAIGAGHRWRAALGALGVGVALLAIGFATVRSSPRHPTASLLTYALDADATDAWVTARSGSSRPGSWGAGALGPSAKRLLSVDSASSAGPAWLARAIGGGQSTLVVAAPRVSIEPPSATVISDSIAPGARYLVLRVRAAPGTEVLGMRARPDGARVLASAIDGRPISTTRYRAPVRQWRLDYTAPPDSGVTLSLTAVPGSPISLDLTARSAGIPALPGVSIAPRPNDVVTAQTGDVTIVHRTVRIE